MPRTLEYRLQVMENEMTQLKEDMRNMTPPNNYAEGVAKAAIDQLNQKLDAKEAERAAWEEEVARLQQENLVLRRDQITLANTILNRMPAIVRAAQRALHGSESPAGAEDGETAQLPDPEGAWYEEHLGT